MKNKSSETFHTATVLRRVEEWVSPTYLTETQLQAGITFTELCVFLFMIKMSRGHDDERTILQVFLLFLNR